GAPFPELTIDMTGAGREGVVFSSGVSSPSTLTPAGYFVNPHPAAIALGRTLALLERAFGLGASFVTILEPASERGRAAVEELQEQTVSLLNFQPVERRVFSAQLAFNLLPESAASSRTESIVGRQLQATLGERVSLPRLMVTQAPTFHGHALCLFVDLPKAPTVDEIVECFAGEPGAFTTYSEGAGASPVEVIGNDRIHISRVFADARHSGSYGLWIAIDNLRIAASNAIQTAERLMFAPAPQG
ncbi:MAG TPA: Asd/ArgC dimerization domain-containing protein, partial [Terriglobia bacterium]|nr:Asd/ArgC dimerization domain-containing protein [Terriglobia bacterium]